MQIWTDVDGVLSADPRKVPEAKVLPEVSVCVVAAGPKSAHKWCAVRCMSECHGCRA